MIDMQERLKDKPPAKLKYAILNVEMSSSFVKGVLSKKPIDPKNISPYKKNLKGNQTFFMIYLAFYR